MSELRDLYQEVILDHGKRPRNFRTLEHYDCKADGHNPLCGDRITVYVRIEDGKIAELSFSGSGCAISQASASLMTEALVGRDVAEVEAIFNAFHDLVTGHEEAGEALPSKLVVFSGVSEFPVRVKCATQPWHTLKAALAADGQAVSTE